MDEPRYTAHHQRLRRYGEQYIEDEARYPELDIPLEHVKAVVFAFLEDMRNREMREAGEWFDHPLLLAEVREKYPTRAERHRMFGEPTDGTLFRSHE